MNKICKLHISKRYLSIIAIISLIAFFSGISGAIAQAGCAGSGMSSAACSTGGTLTGGSTSGPLKGGTSTSPTSGKGGATGTSTTGPSKSSAGGKSGGKLPPGAVTNNFGTIALNISESVKHLPGLLAGISYLLGLLMSVKAVFMLKECVDYPMRLPLRNAVMSLLAGGALFGLPIILESMHNTINPAHTASTIGSPQLRAVEFKIN